MKDVHFTFIFERYFSWALHCWQAQGHSGSHSLQYKRHTWNRFFCNKPLCFIFSTILFLILLCFILMFLIVWMKRKTIFKGRVYFSSVQLSRSVVSDLLQPHGLQHARPPCPSPSPGVHSDSRPSSPWCHPAMSSSVVPFSSCPQSLQASESFPMSQIFAWGGQSTGASALASFLPKKSQGWSPRHNMSFPY